MKKIRNTRKANAHDTLPDSIVVTIDKAVSDAFERLDIDSLIQDAIADLDIITIVRNVMAEAG